ncbi:MAG: hypothetical protein IAG13_09510 [Deltaproteobacteria bacterium]|nr:hypothetical protein [Nannocystaceae bacterium]
MLAELQRAGVRYVVIGGMAAALRGSPVLTQDVDVCPARDLQNLQSLARALRSLAARIRTDTEPAGLPFACNAEFFARVQMVNLVTRCGDLDVSFQPSGTAGYEDLRANAECLELGPGLSPAIASLADVIRSKTAADRPKDRAALPALRTLEAEIRRRRGE